MTDDECEDPIDEILQFTTFNITCTGGQQFNTWVNAPTPTPARGPLAHPAADRLRATIARLPATPSVRK